jgi:hypothetical protein
MTSLVPVPEPDSDYNAEAREIIRILKASGVWPGGVQFSAKDMSFARDLERNPERRVTQRMIFWLRDIRDRSLE